jgi:hypothetical protein
MIPLCALADYPGLSVHALLTVAGVLFAVVMWGGIRISDALRKRKGERWPVVDGRIVSHCYSAMPEPDSDDPLYEPYMAEVIYAYRMGTGTDGENYYDRFTRGFREEADAEAWLRSLDGRRIPVHVRPGKPGESMVLTAELEREFGATTEGGAPKTLLAAAARPGARYPRKLHTLTRWGAWVAAACFCAAVCDHLYRLLAGRPAQEQMAPALWAIAVFLGLPFWFWYRRNTRNSVLPWAGATAPQYLQILTRGLTLYVACEWLVRMVMRDWLTRMQFPPARLDPVENGAILALLFGNVAANLYVAMEQTEDPSDPSTWNVTQE